MIVKRYQIQSASTANLSQMKPMKVSCNKKNMTNLSFQHFVECELIEVMSLKLHQIRFVSIVTLIRLHSSEIAGNSSNSSNAKQQLKRNPRPCVNIISRFQYLHTLNQALAYNFLPNIKRIPSSFGRLISP
jgi:hypothetical protein